MGCHQASWSTPTVTPFTCCSHSTESDLAQTQAVSFHSLAYKLQVVAHKSNLNALDQLTEYIQAD